MYQGEMKWNEMSRSIDFTVKDLWYQDRSIILTSEWVIKCVSEWVSE